MASIRLRRRDDGTKRYQVRADGFPTKTFELKEDAERYRLECDRQRLLGPLYVAPAERFGTFLDAYIERKRRRGARPATIARTKDVANRLRPLRKQGIPQLRRAGVEDLLAEIAADAPRQAQMATALVKAVLRAARDRGQLVDEAIFSIERPRYQEREPRFLDVEQLFTLGTWMPEYIRRIVPVAGLTGLRQGELFGLAEDDLELDAKRLRVRRGKTKAAQRTVDLSSEVVTLLREQLMARPWRTRLVFPAPGGGQWNASNFMFRVFRPARDAAGLDGLTFHDLRHSYCSLMLRAGAPTMVIAQQLGHADGGVLVHRRYGHLFGDEGAAAAAKLDALVRAVVDV